MRFQEHTESILGLFTNQLQSLFVLLILQVEVCANSSKSRGSGVVRSLLPLCMGSVKLVRSEKSYDRIDFHQVPLLSGQLRRLVLGQLL